MNRRLIRPLGAAVVASVVVTVSVLAGSGCEQAKSTGTGPAVGVQPEAGGLDLNNFHQLWMNVLPLDQADSVSKTYLRDDMIVACTPRNVVYIVNNNDGVLRYFRYVDGGGREIGSPLLLPKYIVFPGQATLQVYNRIDGDLAKSIPLNFTLSSNAVGDDDQLYIGADRGGGQLADIDLTRNYVPVRWSLITFGEVRGAPGFYDGVLYIGSSDGGVRAVDSDRQAYWLLEHDTFNTGGPIAGDVKADDSGVYAASESGRIVCLDRDTGKLKWQYFAQRTLTSGPVVTRTTVYQYVPTVGLVALDKTKLIAVDPNGRPRVEQMNRDARWVCPEAEQFVSEDEQFTYVRTADNQLWALDHATGEVRFRGQGTRFGSIATNLRDSTIYATTEDGVIYGIKPILKPGSPGYLQ